MGVSLKSNNPRLRKLSHAPRFSTSSLFPVHSDLPAFSSLLCSYLQQQHGQSSSLFGHRRRSPRMRPSAGFFLESIPRGNKRHLISLDISECNEINHLRRFRAKYVVFTGGNCGYATRRGCAGQRIRRVEGEKVCVLVQLEMQKRVDWGRSRRDCRRFAKCKDGSHL